VVVAGYWNPRIFSALWVTTRLGASNQIAFEVPMDPGLPLRLAFDGVHLAITSDQMILTVDRAEDALVERCLQLAMRALQELPNTPTKAVGVNFAFVATPPGRDLLSAFDIKDNNAISDAGIRIQSTTIQRTLLDGDQVVNFSLSNSDDGKVLLGFNFHKDTPTAQAALAFLEAQPTGFKQRATEIIGKIYGAAAEDPGLNV